MGSRLLHPLEVVLCFSAGGRMTRRGRRARADAGEGGHGRAHVGADVVVAILVANRQVRSVVGK